MPPERVLVCGAGVTGSIAAFWLARYGFQVVVIERSKAGQKAGQGIEIEEPALQVVKSMGILDELNERKTGELGFELVDEKSRSYGRLGVGDAASFTGSLELMRGDLTEVLYKAADKSDNVTYEFETTIQSLRQTQDKVIVDVENRVSKKTKTEEFDYVVGADGAKSRTRELIMSSSNKPDHFNHVGAFVSYFSVPKEDGDWPDSRVCQFKDRRIVWTRPVAKDSKTSSVYFIYVCDDIPKLRQANASGDRSKQKEVWAELYGDLGWEVPRVLEGMRATDNFYSDELVQVKLPTWSQQRVVLAGDSAWAPTPFTGQGNQLAIIGAWVLAQEMSRIRSPAAFESYEKRLRSYVENSQSIPLGGYAPYIFVPQTSWGIWLFRISFSFVAKFVHFLSWTKLSSYLPEDRVEHPFDLQMEVDEKEKGEGKS